MLNVVLLIELVSLALVAGLAGLICGYLIAASLLPDVAASLRGLYGAQIPGQLTLRPEWWIAGLAISVLGALAAAATSLDKGGPSSRTRGRAALCLATGATAMAAASRLACAHRVRRRRCFLWFGDSLISGFAVLAALLLGAALGLPVVLGFVLYLGQRSARRPLAAWFWADSRQQLSGFSLALMALLLALAVNVGVGTMVESFSKTFSGWIDGRLAADIYLNASDDAQAADIMAWLR